MNVFKHSQRKYVKKTSDERLRLEIVVTARLHVLRPRGTMSLVLANRLGFQVGEAV